MNDRIFYWPRGKGLGGSSAVNYMMFSHCTKRDLDNWVELGNPGWGWEDMVPYFRKFEHYVPTDATTGEKYADKYIDPSLHGTDGPVKVAFSSADFNWLNQVTTTICC